MPYVAPTAPAVGDLITAAQGAIIAADIAAGPNMGTPTSTTTNGTASSGTTETRDAVLGNYSFTAVAGRRYMAVLSCAHLAGSVADDQYVTNIRNGGASTPTAASTLIGGTRSLVTTAAFPQPVAITATFVPGAGAVTLGVFTVRTTGTGVGTPASAPSTSRELYALDIGPA